MKIRNFYSVEDEILIDMRVPAKTPQDDRFVAIDGEQDLRLKKVLCLIGANASGKTTILRAIGFLRMFISHSFEVSKAGDDVATSSFDDLTGPDNFTSIEVEFVVAPEDRAPWAKYRYRVEVANQEPDSVVQQERLEAAKLNEKYVRIFDRQRVGDSYTLKHHPTFELKRDDPRAKARSNVSLISNLLQFDHEPSERFSSLFQRNFLSNVAVNKSNLEEQATTEYLMSSRKATESFIEVIRKIDVGISDFEINEVRGENMPWFKHDGRSNLNSLFFESQGTKNFYCLFPYINFAKEMGACAAIDELDSDLHPNLVLEIIRWFQDAKESTPFSQLITTLNHPSVLSYLEKEEVGIVEKDSVGRTTYIPLSDFEGVRRDTNLYKKYMGGHFGGLPVFG